MKFVNSLGGLIKRMSNEDKEKLAQSLEKDGLRETKPEGVKE